MGRRGEDTIFSLFVIIQEKAGEVELKERSLAYTDSKQSDSVRGWETTMTMGGGGARKSEKREKLNETRKYDKQKSDH
jgi:hypothetical protein